jgi:hypothetical protein
MTDEIESKADADVLSYPTSETDTYLVHYGEDESGEPIVQYEQNNYINRVIFGRDENDAGHYGEIQGTLSIGDVTLISDLHSRTFELTVDGHTVVVPDEKHEELLDGAIEAVEFQSSAVLRSVYEEILDGRVREGQVNAFADRYDEDRVTVTDEGWEIDETFLVTWDGENYLTTGVEKTDEMGARPGPSNDQAVEFDFETPESDRTVADPNGTERVLYPDEQSFLATVEVLLYPDDYVGQELVEEIEQKRQQESIEDLITDIASQGNEAVEGFISPTSGVPHGHSFEKHTLDDLNVTEEAIDHLHYDQYDHAGPHELLKRRDYFENASYDVFEDADNDDETKWAKIESTADKAYIPPSVEDELREMFDE